jgi:hypothetical protein
MLITKKDRMRSDANLRPCLECLTKDNRFVLTETCCTNVLSRPVVGLNVPQAIRCHTGVCAKHTTELTIMGRHIEVCCPDCFRTEVLKKMTAPRYGVR